MQPYVLIGAAALFFLSLPVGLRAYRRGHAAPHEMGPRALSPESRLDDRRLYDEPSSEMRLFLD